MKKSFLTLALIISYLSFFAQNQSLNQNSADKILLSDNKLSIGGYGQMDYYQPLSKDLYKNGVLDVHRLVLMFGYKFNERTNIITEIEFEHVNEVYVEQAFLDYKIAKWINFRGGLMLVPMGLINEYHEPNTYNGVNRPMVDTKIIPTTWRELGAGFTGSFNELSIKYQAYLMNGFNGYSNGTATINGNDAFRKARQKGIKSYMSSPNFTSKVEYYGLKSFNFGLSAYFGNTQSSLYNNISRDDNQLVSKADSSVIKMNMVALDAKYHHKGLQLRGQFVYSKNGNTAAYNTIAKNKGTNKGIGSSMLGYYIEASYNVFQLTNIEKSELIPFVRYERYDTQNSIDEVTVKNDAFNNSLITTGIGWKITPKVVVKTDVEFAATKANTTYYKTLNMGIGFQF